MKIEYEIELKIANDTALTLVIDGVNRCEGKLRVDGDMVGHFFFDKVRVNLESNSIYFISGSAFVTYWFDENLEEVKPFLGRAGILE